MKTIITVLIFLAILGGCKEEDIQEVQLGDSAELRVGESIVLDVGDDQWEITFVDVSENSICPPDLICVWQGRFIVELRIENDLRQIGTGDLSNTEIENILIRENVKITLTDANTNSIPFTRIELFFEANS